MDEAAYWKESCFMTLTFNNECLPLDGSLSKEVIQKYVKRVRKNTDKMKYYLCGEYGESNMRPHYHVIFLAWVVRTKKSWTKAGVLVLRISVHCVLRLRCMLRPMFRKS